MKSFLDRLMGKREKTPTQGAETSAPKPEQPAVDKTAAIEPPPASLVTGPQPAQEAPPPKPTPGTIASNEPDKDSTIVLKLGDFIDRIPASLLRPGPIDRMLPLHFDIQMIARQFFRSDPRIRVAEIYRRQPKVFARELNGSDTSTVLLPWQKIINMVTAKEGNTSAIPPEVLATLTKFIREQRAATETATGTGAQAGKLPTDTSNRSWFSPKAMPAGALITLPSTLRPPPTASESIRLPRATAAPTQSRSNGQTPPATPPVEIAAAPEFEQAAVTKPRATPQRPPSEVLGEQLAAISGHFGRMVRQLEETAQTQITVHAQHQPGLEHLLQAAEKKLSTAKQERDAVASLKQHLDSQFEALTFAQNGVATLQETIEAQSREFGRIQGLLTNLESQLTTMTTERDTLAVENAKLAEDLSQSHTPEGATPDTAQIETTLRNRISELEAQLDHPRPAAPVLARISAARALTHRMAGGSAGARGAKPRPIRWPAYLNTLNARRLAATG